MTREIKPSLGDMRIVGDFQCNKVQTCTERIQQLRRAILVHSYLYYAMHRQIISDKEFDDKAYELVQLQRDYPYLSKAVPYEYEAFKDFDGSTGFDLPYQNPAIREIGMTLYIDYVSRTGTSMGSHRWHEWKGFGYSNGRR